ncbi:putative pre-mRNA-splicing factor ATP-dependent RNA helicase DEAH3 [Glycine soja]
MARFNLKLCITGFNSRDYYVNIRKEMLASCRWPIWSGQDIYLTMKNNQSYSVGWKIIFILMIYVCFLSSCCTCIHHIAWTTSRSRLMDVAPHYYDLSNFPQCEVKCVLERLYKKREKEKEEAKSRK